MTGFNATNNPKKSSKKNWFTPKYIIDALGPFDLDVCTLSTRPFDIAKRHIEYDKGQDSIKIDWGDSFVWMSPPYGKEILPFMKKFNAHKNGIGLTFARMGTKWMQEFLKTGTAIFFLRKRIDFINIDGITKEHPSTDSCLLLHGKEAVKRAQSSDLKGVLVYLH